MNGAWSIKTSGGANGYDALNRLTAAQATTGPYVGMQATWSYDSFGNRLAENLSLTPPSGSTVPVPSSSAEGYDANNHISSVDSNSVTPTYDDSGNMTTDTQGNQYLYDADGHVCAVSGLNGRTGYLYNAEGVRIAKGAISAFSCDTSTNGFQLSASYILGPDHQQLTELNWSGGTETPGYTNVRAGGQLIAHYDLSGSQAALYFHFGDWLGTLRVVTDAAGNVSPSGVTCISLPYGNGEYCTPTQSTNYLFNAKERDPETGGPNGNDYFGARYYASTMGQFLTPDWSAKAEPVPYAKVENPQSLNLYRYVFDNPLTGVDLDGHQNQEEQTVNNEMDQCKLWTSMGYPSFCGSNFFSVQEAFAEMERKIGQPNQQQQKAPIVLDFTLHMEGKGTPLTCANDPACMLQYSQAFGSIRRIPQLQAPNTGTIAPLSRAACASMIADSEYSIAAHTSGSSPDNPIVQALLGNSVSGLYNMWNAPSISSGLKQLVVGGYNPGIPGGIAIDGGLAGVYTNGAIKAATTNLGEAAGETGASVVGATKFAYDLGAWAYAYVKRCR